MEKCIVFTVSRKQYGIEINTKSMLADNKDKHIDTVAVALLYEMDKLTSKYNNKDIAVLFEVE